MAQTPMDRPVTSERESLIDDLRRDLGRVRAALVESMDWGWSVYFPPEEILARFESALEITDSIAEFFGVVSSSDQKRQPQGILPKAA